MKHCKKLVAVLLAAVMLLSMLTACGGTGTTSTKAKAVEDTLVEIYSEILNLSGTNDLRSDAAAVLSRVGAGGAITGEMYSYSVGIGTVKVATIVTDGDRAMAMAVDADLTAQQKAVAKATAEQIKASAEAQASLAKFKKLGVAAKEIDGKIYVAVAFEVGI